jgi:predicted phage-related endonuclease
VFGADGVALDVLFGGSHYRRYEFPADPELGEMLAAACTQFMDRVREGRPPQPQLGHPDTADTLARRYPGEPKTIAKLSPKAVEALLELESLSEQAAWVDDRQEELRNLVRAEMGDAELGQDPFTGKVVVSWTAADPERRQFTMKDFREQYPHLYRVVERKLAKPAPRSTRINLRRKALADTRDAWITHKEK